MKNLKRRKRNLRLTEEKPIEEEPPAETEAKENGEK